MNQTAGDQEARDPQRVLLVPWDPEWPGRFQAEHERLCSALSSPPERIQHVGSTSVPGMRAQPVIDILVGVESLQAADAASDALADLGYWSGPASEATLPGRRHFRHPETRPSIHHLYCVVFQGAEWERTIGFRDLLRADGTLAFAYGRLNADLASRFGRDSYQQRKGPFIRRALAGANR